MFHTTLQVKFSRHDKNFSNNLADTVQKRFPEATSKAIKATMAQKCKYLRLPRRKGNAKTTADDKTAESKR